MKINKNIYIGVFILLLALMIIFIFNPFRKLPPEGVPDDYFEKIEQLSKIDVDIKIYGNAPLSKRVPHKKITKLDYNEIRIEKTYKFLILDMENIDYLTKEDVEVISNLYYKSCYNIFIIGLEGSKYDALQDLVKYEDRNEKFIMLRFLACGGPYHSNALRNAYITNNHKEYAIMDMMLKTIKNIENSKRD